MNFTCNTKIVCVFSWLFLAANVCADETHLKTIQWQSLEISITGPLVSESDKSTFTDYRLTATFIHKDKTIRVPGFFAGDGNAQHSHARQGNLWQVRFAPDQVGEWRYSLTLEKGENVALMPATQSAKTINVFSGRLSVAPAEINHQSRSFYQRGRLMHTDSHIQRLSGSRQPFIKAGTGSPENLLAYIGFDGTYDAGEYPRFPSLGESQLHQYLPHSADWQEGDPNWLSEAGRDAKPIIGMMNYLGEVGVNSFYFITLTYHGDGWDVWPWVSPDNFYQFDISKLAQWEVLFQHMQQQGIHLHMLLTETENESLFELREGGDFSMARKLYYREMIARFSHHLALTWNIGEESGWDDEKGKQEGIGVTHDQRIAFSHFIRTLDPYDHPIKAHEIESVAIFPQQLDNPHFSGPSLQRHNDYNTIVREHVEMGYTRQQPWLVSMDEPLGWEFGLQPNAEASHYDMVRREVLWGSLMGGAMGVEWYFGWQNNAPTSDLSNEDMRNRAPMWQQSARAARFFVNHTDVMQLYSDNGLLANANQFNYAYAMRASDEQIVVYYAVPERDAQFIAFQTLAANSRYKLSLFKTTGDTDLTPYTTLNTDKNGRLQIELEALECGQECALVLDHQPDKS